MEWNDNRVEKRYLLDLLAVRSSPLISSNAERPQSGTSETKNAWEGVIVSQSPSRKLILRLFLEAV